MGQHFITPAHAGIRQRDDYGAVAGHSFTRTCLSILPSKKSKSSRLAGSFPVVQPVTVGAKGRLNHVA